MPRSWVILLLWPLLAAAADDPPLLPPDPLPLEWCLERASERNPEIAADEAASQAAQHRIDPAGSLDDPRFGYELSNVPRGDLDLDSTPLSGQQLRLAQKLPFPGLLGNREHAATAAARAAFEQFLDRRRRVESAAERAWSELGFVQRALEITDQNLDLLRQLTNIAEARYRVGTGLQQDVLRAQVELTTLLQERLRREAAIQTASAALAAILDLPPGTGFPRTAPLAEVAPVPDPDALLLRLEEASPRLRSLTARVEEAERLERVAILEGYPDFDLGIGYRLRERVAGDPVRGDDYLMAGVTVRLPVNRTKWTEKIAERRALLRRARAAYRAERASLRDRLRSAFADLVRADAEVDLLGRGLVPQARQSLESSRSGYAVGKVDFLSLLDSQVSLFQAELLLVRALVDRRSGFAEIEGVLGEDVR